MKRRRSRMSHRSLLLYMAPSRHDMSSTSSLEVPDSSRRGRHSLHKRGCVAWSRAPLQCYMLPTTVIVIDYRYILPLDCYLPPSPTVATVAAQVEGHQMESTWMPYHNHFRSYYSTKYSKVQYAVYCTVEESPDCGAPRSSCLYLAKGRHLNFVH